MWAPWPISFAHNSLINPKKWFHGVSGLLELCRICFQCLLLFQPEFQLPAFPFFMVNLRDHQYLARQHAALYTMLWKDKPESKARFRRYSIPTPVHYIYPVSDLPYGSQLWSQSEHEDDSPEGSGGSGGRGDTTSVELLLTPPRLSLAEGAG